MLSNEQCIEVAELWGWKWIPDGAIPSGNEHQVQGRWWSEGSVIKYYRRDCSELVNSWQGFGRTVEAMAKRKWALSDSSSTGICFYSHIGDEVPIKVTDDWENPRMLIDATHLAALEAMKNDND